MATQDEIDEAKSNANQAHMYVCWVEETGLGGTMARAAREQIEELQKSLDQEEPDEED